MYMLSESLPPPPLGQLPLCSSSASFCSRGTQQCLDGALQAAGRAQRHTRPLRREPHRHEGMHVCARLAATAADETTAPLAARAGAGRHAAHKAAEGALALPLWRRW